MPSVISLKDIRSNNSLKDQMRKLELEKEELEKQLAFQKKVEAKLRDDIINHKKDFEHLEKQFEHFAGLEQDYEELQNTLQMERLEKLISSENAVDNKSNEQLDKAKADLKKVQDELKELKKLDPQRLKRQVVDLKKKSATQAGENKNLNKALVAARKELRDMTQEKEQCSQELEACRRGTDYFWQSDDAVWQLYESKLLIKGDDPKAKEVPSAVICLNATTGTRYLSRELDDKELAIWLEETADIPEQVSIEAGKRHKKIAAEAAEEA